MKACEICDDRTSLLSCPHVGSICFDCWGSGIHEVMKRKVHQYKDWQSIREELRLRLEAIRRANELYIAHKRYREVAS